MSRALCKFRSYIIQGESVQLGRFWRMIAWGWKSNYGVEKRHFGEWPGYTPLLVSDPGVR